MLNLLLPCGPYSGEIQGICYELKKENAGVHVLKSLWTVIVTLTQIWEVKKLVGKFDILRRVLSDFPSYKFRNSELSNYGHSSPVL